MALNFTGGKYSSATLSAVGTTTVTVGSATFSSGDFAFKRLVAIFDSSSQFKGIGFVRRYVSTTQLELEKDMFDPATGIAITQVIGDIILVSKNSADVATTGWAVSGSTITVTDTVTWGTGGSQTSVCFYDELKQIKTNSVWTFNGGVVVFGKLNDYATNDISGGCNFYFTTSASTSIFKVNNAAANVVMYGGSISGENSPSYIGGYLGSAPYTIILNKIYTPFDLISPGAGGTWGANKARCQLVDCFSETDKTNAIMVRWGDGEIRGGRYRIPNYATAPLSIFGTDAAGSYTVAAPAGKRGVVLDIGNSNRFCRTNSTINVTYTVENFISTDLYIVSGTSDSANNNGTMNYYFRDTYSNLVSGSVVALIRDSSWTADDSDTAGANGEVSPAVFWQQAVGKTLGGQRGPWTSRVRKYGYDEIESAVAEADYSLGSAGTAKNVSFGGAQNQVPRSSLGGIPEATADGYAGISITDHGASPVSWNSKSWSVTVTVDLSTYPSRTAAEVFAHIKSGIAKSTTFNGKAGYLWHVLVEESSGAYVTQRGKSGGAGATLKGVRVIDNSGNPFPGFTQMQADDGTYYTPPTTVTVELTGIVTGSRVRIERQSDGGLLSEGTVAGTTYTYSPTHTVDVPINIAVRKGSSDPKYLPYSASGTITSSGFSLVVSQIEDTIA